MRTAREMRGATRPSRPRTPRSVILRVGEFLIYQKNPPSLPGQFSRVSTEKRKNSQTLSGASPRTKPKYLAPRLAARQSDRSQKRGQAWPQTVILGLDPRIHPSVGLVIGMDARVRPGHD